MGQIAHIGDDEHQGEDDDDGMGGAHHRYHCSEKILGRLYRNIDEKRIWAEDISRAMSQKQHGKHKSVWDQLLDAVEVHLDEYMPEVWHERQTAEAWRIRNL